MKNISVLCTAAAVLVAIASAMAENEKPVIISQPTSVKAKVGDSVTFTIVAKDINTTSGKNFTTAVMGTTELDMIWVDPGTFMMGSPELEWGRSDNETLHQVTLTKGFWMGKYEVTQAQYKAVMGGIPRDDYGSGDNYPVYGVSFESVSEFCNRLTATERAMGKLSKNYKYTLPTEAQWEYACRAGTTTALNNGKNLVISYDEADANLDEIAWYRINCNDDRPREVGQKLPNAWGFYDMHGNVQEWCLDGVNGDYFDPTIVDYTSDAAVDPYLFPDVHYKILRGGGWCTYLNKNDCRSASRDYGDVGLYAGFRVVLVPVE